MFLQDTNILFKKIFSFHFISRPFLLTSSCLIICSYFTVISSTATTHKIVEKEDGNKTILCVFGIKQVV